MAEFDEDDPVVTWRERFIDRLAELDRNISTNLAVIIERQGVQQDATTKALKKIEELEKTQNDHSKKIASFEEERTRAEKVKTSFFALIAAVSGYLIKIIFDHWK